MFIFLADDSHEISRLVFFEKLNKKYFKMSSAEVVIGALRVNKSMLHHAYMLFVNIIQWTQWLLCLAQMLFTPNNILANRELRDFLFLFSSLKKSFLTSFINVSLMTYRLGVNNVAIFYKFYLWNTQIRLHIPTVSKLV